MPTFAELKAKAATVTSAGVEKMQNIRDRNTSVPMAKTNWDPYSGEAPPPPPPPRSSLNLNSRPQSNLLSPPSRTSPSANASRTNSVSPAPPPLPSRSSSSAIPTPPSRSVSSVPPRPSLITKTPSLAVNPGPPPPVHKFTRPDLKSRQTPQAAAEKEIDWANLSRQDKEVFFNWLDEFFSAKGSSQFSGHAVTGSSTRSHVGTLHDISRKEAPQNFGKQPIDSFVPLSYPPPTEHGSAALDLAHYFSPLTPWQEAWYSSGDFPIPPPLVGGKDHVVVMSSVTTGSHKTLKVGTLFSDLSMFWGVVEYTKSNPKDPRTTKRSAQYLPRPESLSQEQLIEAHEAYGDTIALYAESFLGSGQVCGRGECWDLAHEALKYFQDYDYVPKPVPSIGRTHGHLIFEARVSDRGRKTEGRWRGGDNRIRRGDIVEWRKVRIGLRGGFATLGDPDHTAIIVADAIPRRSPSDGERMSPGEIGTLTVIEQSQGKLPERREYDLKCLEEGEMWVYRPISMQVYLGVADLTAEAPGNHVRLERL